MPLLAHEPLLATRHVEALLFTAGTPLSQARTCRKTLRTLTDWGLLHRERRPPGRVGGGSDSAVFALTAAGDGVLALRDGRELHRVRRPEDRGQSLTAHLLAVADLHVAVVMAARSDGAAVGWVSEPDCWYRFTGPAGPELLKPDAYVEVRGERATRLAWIEVDRGTQSLRVIESKVRRYCRAAKARAAMGAPVPVVLFAVTQERRRLRVAERLATWASAEGLRGSSVDVLIRALPPADIIEHLCDRASPR